MKFKKILFALTITTGLATSSIIEMNTNTVKAASFNYYSTKGFYHFKHKVVLTRPITIRKEHFYPHSFYTYLKEKKTLPAGTQIKILPYGDKGYYWIVLYGNPNKSTWVYPPKKTDWFDTYAKYHYFDSSLFLNRRKETGNIVRLTWSQYRKMWRLLYSPNKLKKWYKSAHLPIVGHTK